MNKIKSKQSLEKKKIVLFFFLIFSLFISENVIAWKLERFKVYKDPKSNCIKINTRVYEYGNPLKQGYLKYCRIQVSEDGGNYYNLMDINTQWPTHMNPKTTKIDLYNKLDNAQIEILNDITPGRGKIWPEKTKLTVMTNNQNGIGELILGWNALSHVRSLRITGLWCKGVYDEPFVDVVYRIPQPSQSKLK